jgi:hypothetical protein
MPLADSSAWHPDIFHWVPSTAYTPLMVPSEKYPDARHSNPRAALRRFLSERSDFLVVPDYTTTGISNFPDCVLRKTG